MGGGLFLVGYYFGFKEEGREVEATRTAEITDRPGDFARTIDPIDPSLQSPTQSVELEEAKRITEKGESLADLLYRAQAESSPIVRYASFAKALANRLQMDCV